MGCTYTYQSQDHNAVWNIIDSATHIPLAPSWPAVIFDRAFHTMTLGVPLAGHFQCSFSSIAKPNSYNNHDTIKTLEVEAAIRQKFVKEEELSYNVVFQRWIWCYIASLFLNPLTFVMPKYDSDMGQICVDGTNVIDCTNDGAPNQQIPKPGTTSQWDENPPISYGSALERCLIWLYNLCIDHPLEDLLMLPDDISTTFHQIFYHPCMMPVFASVFDCHLCIPAGSIFGSASSPGFYMVVGELWAWAAGAIDFKQAQVRFMLNTLFPPEPMPVEVASFSTATPDAFNPGAAILMRHGAAALYPVFVDEMGNTNTRSKIYNTITASVLAAYLLFGFPGGDT